MGWPGCAAAPSAAQPGAPKIRSAPHLTWVDAVEEVGGESDEAWLVDDRGTACRIWGFVLAPVGIGLNADATN